MTRDQTQPALSTEARVLVAWLHRHARGRTVADLADRSAAELAAAMPRLLPEGDTP